MATINDVVVKIATVNGTGSASANRIYELVMTPRGIEVIITREGEPDVKRLFLGVGG